MNVEVVRSVSASRVWQVIDQMREMSRTQSGEVSELRQELHEAVEVRWALRGEPPAQLTRGSVPSGRVLTQESSAVFISSPRDPYTGSCNE